jgi:catechol 2,3-dioxygenase
MHLHVANIPEAEAFYTKAIGFDLILDYRGVASFFSAGGYHHHVAVNTWNGVDAPPPPPDAVGLRYFVVQLPNQDEQTKLIARLEKANVSFEARKDGLFVRDPSQNGLMFTVREMG